MCRRPACAAQCYTQHTVPGIHSEVWFILQGLVLLKMDCVQRDVYSIWAHWRERGAGRCDFAGACRVLNPLQREQQSTGCQGKS